MVAKAAVRYVELCAGIGGTRAGLDAAGWKCVFALDHNPDAVCVHQQAFGTCELGDVLDLNPENLPPHDVLVSGFPCQPFSTSGDKKGFHHRSGNVFENVMLAVRHHMPRVVMLENVEGLLSNRFGHSMATVLGLLTSSGYVVEWLTTNAAWFRIPQSRPRVIFIARREDAFTAIRPGTPPWDYSFYEHSAFAPLLREHGVGVKFASFGSLSTVEKERSPRVGLSRPEPSTVFAGAGLAVGDAYYTYKVLAPEVTPQPSLGEICCPQFRAGEVVRSVRYYARGGPTLPYVRKEPIAHCLGTNIGAAPTFAVPLSMLRTSAAKTAVLEFANWRREQAGFQMFRLTPDRALLLFGEGVEPIRRALAAGKVTVTKQYVLIGNMVAPPVARAVGEAVSALLARSSALTPESKRAVARGRK